MPVNKTKTPEEIEKESDMNPEFEIDPILDILREADEKLNIIKATPTKKEKTQKKKSKSAKYIINQCSILTGIMITIVRHFEDA